MKTHFSLLLFNVVFRLLIPTSILLSCSDNDDETKTLPPDVTSISPGEGPKATLVTITGTNFSPTISENEVTVNGKPATITSATATQLTVTVPPAADSGPIVVKSKGQKATKEPNFTFQWSVTTLAGTTQGYVDGSPAKFYSPSGVAADSMGNTYITDFGNHVIRKITAAGAVSTLAGSTLGVIDGLATAAKFYLPNGSAIDKLGNIFISEEGGCRVRKITPTGVVSTLAGNVIGSADGVGMSAQFKQPSGIAVDKQGNVYVADQHNNRIRKITADGIVTTLAGSAAGYADGSGSGAQFYRPTGVVVDAQGNVFVADLFNHKIRKITPSGVVTTIAGSTYGFADGSGTSAKFGFPAGLALDKQGNLYVADSENHRIRKITPAGVVTTFAGTGTSGTNDGIATASQFYAPREIDIDAAGNMYIADAGSNRIRKIE